MDVKLNDTGWPQKEIWVFASREYARYVVLASMPRSAKTRTSKAVGEVEVEGGRGEG